VTAPLGKNRVIDDLSTLSTVGGNERNAAQDPTLEVLPESEMRHTI
jgi:hypothetical protein